jgi:hypothetical protein
MACPGLMVCQRQTFVLVRDRLTSGLQFLCADVDELLDLFRSHVFARPRILPSRFRFDSFGRGLVGILPSLGRGPWSIFRFEDVLEERHDWTRVAGRPQAVLNGIRRGRDRENATREEIVQKGRVRWAVNGRGRSEKTGGDVVRKPDWATMKWRSKVDAGVGKSSGGGGWRAQGINRGAGKV